MSLESSTPTLNEKASEPASLSDREKRTSDLEHKHSGSNSVNKNMAGDAQLGQTATLEAQGEAHFKRLGWKKLTSLLIVEAIALGALSIPSAFATLGMVAGVITTIGMGFVAIYTSWIVGQVKIKYPEIKHYADVGKLMFGKFGYELIGVMFVLELVFLVGSHCLTGTIAFNNISDHYMCSVIFGIISAIVLLLLALPPSFSEVAILGYIDFTSIMAAIIITLIATGIKFMQSTEQAEWSAWPKENISFYEAFNAITNIVFAYSFAVCQFSFMDEMHTVKDYVKSIWALGLIEIVIYTVTGALIYAFVGPDVQSPALLSAGPLISKIAFGVALPVIFISGAINGTVVARYIHGRMYANSVVRFVNTPKGWITWIALVSLITILAWVIAEAIPFFSDLLSICSALFISGFTFYFPALMWFLLLKKKGWGGWRVKCEGVVNGLVGLIGVVVLVAGTYAAVVDVLEKYKAGTVRGPFTCGLI